MVSPVRSSNINERRSLVMVVPTFAHLEDLLYNPVYNALLAGDKRLGFGTGNVKAFEEEVSPFAGFPSGYDKGFEELYNLLPADRKILYATPRLIDEPAGWQLLVKIKGLQFVFPVEREIPKHSIKPVTLGKIHVEEMMRLATLTKPGPFGPRTIEFGHYHGIFENGQLAAMTGQRLHVKDYTEISAVCTHPEYLGKGYAAALIIQQLHLIIGNGQTAFLHVRADNERATALYERLGFKVSREMNFYFMKKRIN